MSASSILKLPTAFSSSFILPQTLVAFYQQTFLEKCLCSRMQSTAEISSELSAKLKARATHKRLRSISDNKCDVNDLMQTLEASQNKRAKAKNKIQGGVRQGNRKSLVCEKFKQKENQKESLIQRSELKIEEFRKDWDTNMRALLDTIKQLERDLVSRQAVEKQNLEHFFLVDMPQLKHSSKVLSMNAELAQLLSVQDYKAAEITRKQISKKIREEQALHSMQLEGQKKRQQAVLGKKHKTELQNMRDQMGQLFVAKILERDQQISKMKKKAERVPRKSLSKQLLSYCSTQTVGRRSLVERNRSSTKVFVDPPLIQRRRRKLSSTAVANATD